MDLEGHPARYLQELEQALAALDKGKLIDLIRRLQGLMGRPRTLFLAGNGGSAATSSHMACDLAKTILGKNPRTRERRLRVICLNDSVPLMTAWANDEGYQYMFAEQLRNLGQAGDFLLVLTGSGNSPNILELVAEAKAMGLDTFGLLGFDGGQARDLLDDCLIVESHNYGVIEDVHGIISHLITDYLKRL